MKRMLASAGLRLGRLLFALRLHSLVIRLGRRSPKVLVYHACEDSESTSIRGLDTNTRPAELAEQLRYLDRHYEIISLARLEDEPPLPGAVVLTFDDGYKSVFTQALPQLRDYGCPATVYLVANSVGGDRLVWVNELAYWYNTQAATAGPLMARELGLRPNASLSAIIDAVRTNYDRATVERLLHLLRTTFSADGTPLPAADGLYLDQTEIDEMSSAGFTFGNHSFSHPDLARLSEIEQRVELEAAQRVIDDLPGGCRSLAYPFGSFDASTRRVAGKLGFSSVMQVGGRNSPLKLDRVARIPVAGGGAAELFAQMEIITPLKALARGLVRRTGQSE